MQQTEELAPVEHDENLPRLDAAEVDELEEDDLEEVDELKELDIEDLELVGDDDDFGEIEKEIKSSRAKPKVVRKNIEHYFEERALKRRIDDVFEDFLDDALA